MEPFWLSSDQYRGVPVNAPKVQHVIVPSEQDGQRVDNFLMSRLRGLPRSRLYRLLRRGEVRVNKGRVSPSHRLKAGDSVRIPPVSLADRAPPAAVSPRLQSLLEQSIRYEDEQLMVLDKPAGLAVHGGSGVNLGLIESLRQLRTDCRYLELAHRLDRETSGALVIAKQRSALLAFQRALRARQVNKYYRALAVGRWPSGLDSVNAPLKKNHLQSGERIVRTDADGKPSQTRFKVLRRFTEFTLLEAMPVTGRTHQIRVHAQVAGHPLCGDEKYGNAQVNKALREQHGKQLFLHAYAIDLGFDGGPGLIECPLPASWEQFMQGLTVVG